MINLSTTLNRSDEISLSLYRVSYINCRMMRHSAFETNQYNSHSLISTVSVSNTWVLINEYLVPYITT